MYYSALLKLASTFLLASYVHTYDLHCSCADKGGAIAELTNKCCSQQKAVLQIDYMMNDVDCSKDASKFDDGAFLNCCKKSNVYASCWTVV